MRVDNTASVSPPCLSGCRQRRATVPKQRVGIDDDDAEDMGQEMERGMGRPLQGRASAVSWLIREADLGIELYPPPVSHRMIWYTRSES